MYCAGRSMLPIATALTIDAVARRALARSSSSIAFWIGARWVAKISRTVCCANVLWSAPSTVGCDQLVPDLVGPQPRGLRHLLGVERPAHADVDADRQPLDRLERAGAARRARRRPAGRPDRAAGSGGTRGRPGSTTAQPSSRMVTPPVSRLTRTAASPGGTERIGRAITKPADQRRPGSAHRARAGRAGSAPSRSRRARTPAQSP